jgi:ABC-type multidrug transport system permease subunit
MDGYSPANATVNASTEGLTYTANMALSALPSGEIPLWIYGVIALFVIIAVVALAYAFVFKKK